VKNANTIKHTSGPCKQELLTKQKPNSINALNVNTHGVCISKMFDDDPSKLSPEMRLRETKFNFVTNNKLHASSQREPITKENYIQRPGLGHLSYFIYQGVKTNIGAIIIKPFLLRLRDPTD
jgi:hypothetical protein